MCPKSWVHFGLSTFKTNDFQKIYRLSTPTCACMRRKAQEIPGPKWLWDSFFAVVGCQMSNFGVVTYLAGIWEAKYPVGG